MYFQFHTYRHDENEIDLTNMQQQRMYSPRNRHVFVRKTLTLMGHFCVTGQSSIKQRILALEEAYLSDFHETAGLYHDDGTPSAHYLPHDTSLNGIRVLTLDYIKEEGGEYVTGRSYRIVLQADYARQLTLEDNLYSWEQTITMQGAGGPSWEYIPQFIGPPIRQINALITPQRYVQFGESIGVTGYAGYAVIMWPDNEHRDARMIEFGTCLKKGHNYDLLWPMKWRYVFSFPGPEHEFGVPPINP